MTFFTSDDYMHTMVNLHIIRTPLKTALQCAVLASHPDGTVEILLQVHV